MPAGIVSTARGGSLNIDELISKASRPAGPMAKSTQENAHYSPEPAQPRVRGFTPLAGKATLAQETAKPVATKASTTKVAKSKTLAESTGVTLTKTKAKQAPATATPVPEEDSELGELLGKLDK
jgi:hypothetical protein